MTAPQVVVVVARANGVLTGPGRSAGVLNSPSWWARSKGRSQRLFFKETSQLVNLFFAFFHCFIEALMSLS